MGQTTRATTPVTTPVEPKPVNSQEEVSKSDLKAIIDALKAGLDHTHSVYDQYNYSWNCNCTRGII